MARNLLPKCKQCRRAGEKLFLKGARCFSQKCSVTRRNYAPGMHGQKSSGPSSQYGIQLREKQKVKKMYRLMERQFARYFDRADRLDGATTENVIRLLESRLDNVVYRLGIASSRDLARQLVTHGHFMINGRRVTIPSYEVKKGDVIELKPVSKKSNLFSELDKTLDIKQVPEWLSLDVKTLKAEVKDTPDLDPTRLNADLRLLVEFYSK
jgi:small subunit ribosomal protein S4